MKDLVRHIEPGLLACVVRDCLGLFSIIEMPDFPRAGHFLGARGQLNRRYPIGV